MPLVLTALAFALNAGTGQPRSFDRCTEPSHTIVLRGTVVRNGCDRLYVLNEPEMQAREAARLDLERKVGLLEAHKTQTRELVENYEEQSLR